MKKKRNHYDGEFKLNSVTLVLTSKGERTRMHSGLNYLSPAEFEQLSSNEEVRNCA